MRALLIILSTSQHESWAQELVQAAHAEQSVILTTSPALAATRLHEQPISPSHIVIDIGTRGNDILPELDQLAEQCQAGTRVIAVGATNDIVLYRELLARGIVDYLPMPIKPADVLRVLNAVPTDAGKSSSLQSSANKRVITFMSAASGDGASTAALNTACAISQMQGGKTILIDMDYQFGMVAKNLNLKNQYGIRELFDHPERGIDQTLIERMVAQYGKLDVITAPPDLKFLPTVSAEAIRNLLATLKLSYDTIIIDLPHVWLPWVAAAIQQSTHLVLVAQLWLKSVSHASRMMRAFRELNIPPERISTVINRSGAKFKEAIAPADFERVCGSAIHFTMANDIKAIVNAEASARTIIELEPSELADDIQRIARALCGMPDKPSQPATRGGLFSRRKS